MTNTKDLRTTKGILRVQLDMSHAEFQKYINPIISENRNIPIEDAKKQKKVRHTEVLMFYALIGEDVREMAKINA